MKSPNAAGNRSDGQGETGWEGVAAEAGKMQVRPSETLTPKEYQEAREALRDGKTMSQEELHDQLISLARPVGVTDEDMRPKQLAAEQAPDRKAKSFSERIEEQETSLRERLREHPEETSLQDGLVEVESIHVRKQKAKLEKIDEEWHGMSKQERKRAAKEKKKLVADLNRYGYKSGQPDSNFERLASDSLVGQEERRGMGEQRIVDNAVLKMSEGGYTFLGRAVGGEHRAVMKALREHGFKKMPENSHDKNFTSYEMSQMREIAERARKAYDRKHGR